MRRDMDKVLVERPRLGGYGMRKGRVVGDPDLQRRIVGMVRYARERGGYKMLNENLNPLRRFLEGKLNRPWNAVYSEMRERVRPGHTVQEHILTHVPDLIALNVEKVPASKAAPCGLVRNPNGGRNWRSRALKERDLYVDPDDGIIKRARARKIPRT